MTVYTKTMMDALKEVRDVQTEASMSSSQIAMLKKAYEPMRDKKISVKNANKLSALMDKFAKNKDVLLQLAKADIPFVSSAAVTKLISKHGMKGAEINKYKKEEMEFWAELDEGKEKSARQLVDPKREVMVVKKNKVVVIDKKDEDKYLKQGWELAEQLAKIKGNTPADKGRRAAVEDDIERAKKKGDKKEVAKLKEDELDEAKYELYHKDFSSAMQHAYKMAKKLHGITIKPSEIDDKVASGPRKPSEGKTNTYRLEGDKGAIQVQVYNKGGSKPYELNFYKEEVEIDEALPGKWPAPGVKRGTRKDLEKLEKELQAAKKKKDKKKADALQKELERLMKSGKGKKIGPSWMHKEEVEIDEAKSQGMFIVLEKGSKNKVIGQFKDKKKAIDMMKKVAGSKVIQIGKYATVDDKPVDIKIGDKLSDTRVKLATKVKEEVELDEPIKEYNEMGTDEYRKHTQEVTPGETLKEYPKTPSGRARRDAHRHGAMRKSAEIDPADVDTDASDDDVKGAAKNIIMQMRKVVSMRGNFDVEFLDKKKKKVPVKIAQAVQDKYNSFRKPADKEKFQAQVAKSYKDMLKVLKAGYNEEVELDEFKLTEAVSVKDFDSIKKGDTVTIKYESAMSSGSATFKVTAKNMVGKGKKVEKVTMKSTKNPGGVKFFLYKRDNKVGFAIGDMGASVVSFKKEETILGRIDKKLKERKNG